MRVVIPGGSGFLGQALAERLVARGDDVVILSRTSQPNRSGIRTVAWDAKTDGPWVKELDGADAIVHLNGKRVDVRATKKNIDELISSRVRPVTAVGRALAKCDSPPKVWVQSSSLAIFGSTGDELIDEYTTPSGIGPREMVTVCLAWESAFHHAISEASTTRNIRPVLLRIGIGVGGTKDPATAKLAQLVKLGLGGKVGTGRQWVSWVSLDDILSVMTNAIDDPSMVGPFHVTSPNPVTNVQMMAVFRRLLGKKFGLPSPAWVAKIGAPLLGSSASLALSGRRCVPTRLAAQGFVFSQPDYESAVTVALQTCGLL
jgi:uncharacterized protein